MTSDPLMPAHCGLVERAFQLAGSGQYRRLRDVEKHLRREGYYDTDAHFAGCPLLRKQLRLKLAKRETPLVPAGTQGRS